MPKIKVNGANLYYEDTGGAHNVTIVFSHGLLFSCHMFEAQIDALKDRYRCISYDHRGQSQSEVTESGYDLDSLTLDAVELVNQMGVAPVHWVGLSMGGMVGLRLALRHPELMKSLTLIESSSEPEPPEALRNYNMLNFIARWFGLGLVANRAMNVLFGQTFMKDPSREAERKRWRKHLTSHDRIGITRAVKGALFRDDISDQIHNITLPTLIIVGDEDIATVPAKSELMHERIPNSQFKLIPKAGHTSTVEQPEAVNKALQAFLSELKS